MRMSMSTARQKRVETWASSAFYPLVIPTASFELDDDIQVASARPHPFSTSKCALGSTAKLSTALLGVEVLVSLVSPGHDVVAQDHGGCPVEDLLAEPPPCVENSVVGGPGKGVLAVGADAVGDDAPLRPRACYIDDQPRMPGFN